MTCKIFSFKTFQACYVHSSRNHVLTFGAFGRYLTFCDNHKIDQTIATITYKWERFTTACNPFNVYYIVDSRDCDHCRTITAHKAPNGYDYLMGRDIDYQDAEGPVSHRVVSRAEFEAHEASFKDYILEAYENGHPYSVDY
tara:strand:- start:72 stop:494 length:423 start_codon:yes stop_codon:yes gene_type:complete